MRTTLHLLLVSVLLFSCATAVQAPASSPSNAQRTRSLYDADTAQFARVTGVWK